MSTELRTRAGSSVLAFRPRSTTHATSSSASCIAVFISLSRWHLSEPPARRFILRAVLTKSCCSCASSTTTHDRTCGPMPPFRNRHGHIPTGREGKTEFILCCWCLEPPFPTISLFVCSVCEPDLHFRHPPLVARESRTVSSTFNTPKIWAAVCRFANFQTPGTDVVNTPHCLQKQSPGHVGHRSWKAKENDWQPPFSFISACLHLHFENAVYLTVNCPCLRCGTLILPRFVAARHHFTPRYRATGTPYIRTRIFVLRALE